VAGGGVIGLSIAWYLLEAGAEVVVLEAGTVGAGASAGNAGWVSPGLSRPVPGPGVMVQALRWALRPTSPLLVRPSPRLDFVRWSARFARACSRWRFERGVHALLALNERTHELYAHWSAQGIGFEHHRDGLVCVARTTAGLHGVVADFTEMAAAGFGPFTLLDGDGVREHEPSVRPDIVGGVLSDLDHHVRPESLVAGLRAALEDGGVTILEHAPLTALRRQPAGWLAAHGERAEPLAVDAVVLATGAGTARLLRELRGVRFLMEPGRGYSVTFEGLRTGLRRSLELWETRVACTPFDDGLRLAGTMELARRQSGRAAQRLAAVARSAEAYVATFAPDGHRRVEWEGERPLTSDGLPVIGPVPGEPGLHVATGHAMLGMTLAPATGAALAPVVLGERDAAELAPFRIDRPAIRT
jgi:D-amino-acid dehydrogenase